jgi:hypothetical protein
MNQQSGYVTFREEQDFHRVWWVLLLVFGMTALMWWGFVQQIILGEPWGSNPGPVMIGSQKPQDLAEAIEAQLQAQ